MQSEPRVNPMDDIRMHADAMTEWLQRGADLRAQADEYDRLARRHLDAIKRLKMPEPVLPEDRVRASLADSYIRRDGRRRLAGWE